MLGDDPAQTVRYHRFLLGGTRTRLESYRQAIRQEVKPGDVVLDLGSGTGILALLASRAGARKVYAIEMGEVAEVARLLCSENGAEDRVVVIHDRSTHVELPEPADVLVFDIFETFGLQPGGFSAIIDARERLLKGDGILIPCSVDLIAAPAEVPILYQREIDFWNGRLLGVDLSPVRAFAVNNHYPVSLDPTAVLGAPAVLGHIRLSDLGDPHLKSSVSTRATRSGIVHGVCLWFRAELAPGVTVTNEPSATTTNYAQALFPLVQPIPLESGDTVSISVQTFDAAEWRWQIGVNGSPQAIQSTLWGFPLSKSRLLARASDRAPTLSRSGEAKLLLLSRMNGKHTIAQLEAEISQRFPESFRTRREISAFVREVVDRCT